MLNKQASQRRNLWKLVIILPLLSLFLWSFNTREIIKIKPLASANTNVNPLNEKFSAIAKNSTIKFTINKESSSGDLDRIKRILKKEYQVDIKFSKIERNNANEITGISVDIFSKNSNANYAIKNDDAIKAFVISYDHKKDKISIGQNSGKAFYVSANRKIKKGKRTEIIEIHPDNDENHEFIFIGNDEDTKVIKKKDKDGKVIIEKIYGGSDKVFEVHTGDDKTFSFISSDSDKTPLIFIDGKKVSKKEMKTLDSDKIESINVLKGKKAMEKHGSKAENGVIEITIKKK